MKFKPHPYQELALDWVKSHEKCGLFLDMGLGKTVVTLTAIDYFTFDELSVYRTLVVAPKRVAENTWPEEIKKWDHLKDLRMSLIAGNPKERLKAVEKESEIYVISRDNIAWLVNTVKDWKWDCLVIDELSSFKNHRSKRFKALKKVTPFFRKVIGLTGTPSPNGYMDLWSQIYLLDRGKRLGKNITAYRNDYWNSYFKGSYNEYELRKGSKEIIDEKISELCISMKARDYLKDLKESIIQDVLVDLDSKEYEKYKEMEKESVLELEDTDITALNAAAVTNKLLQLANGGAYDEEKNFHHIHDRKLDALEELIEEAQGDNILVFYSFKSDIDRLKERFPDARKLETNQDIEDWNNGKINLLLAHPASAGHGLNLQEGGSIIVWFGLTWSLELYLQANARLQRQGQKEVVRIYRLLAKGTIDETVVHVLNGKEVTQEDLLRKLKAEFREFSNE